MPERGTTLVESERLFDPAREEPPLDAVDVQVPVPLSLALYAEHLRDLGRRAELAALLALHERETEYLVRRVQTQAGYIIGPDSDGWPEPARLALAAVVEHTRPDIDGLRPHLHVYVGATAVSTVTGERRELHRRDRRLAGGKFGDAVDGLWTTHVGRLREATAAEFGFEWDRPVPFSTVEIVEPDGFGRAAVALMRAQPEEERPCPGRWPREALVAGAQSRAWRLADVERGVLGPPPQ